MYAHKQYKCRSCKNTTVITSHLHLILILYMYMYMYMYMHLNGSSYMHTSMSGMSFGSISVTSGSGSGSVGVDGRLQNRSTCSHTITYMYVQCILSIHVLAIVISRVQALLRTCTCVLGQTLHEMTGEPGDDAKTIAPQK